MITFDHREINIEATNGEVLGPNESRARIENKHGEEASAAGFIIAVNGIFRFTKCRSNQYLFFKMGHTMHQSKGLLFSSTMI